MKYNGKELIEMTQEMWDGKSRVMLVWWPGSPAPSQLTVIGYDPEENMWIDRETLTGWSHCAEIPKEEPEKSFKELKVENEELKNIIKSLRADRIKMADSVSHAVWKELMDKTAIDNFNTATPGFRISIISQIVFDNVLKYKEPIEGIIEE